VFGEALARDAALGATQPNHSPDLTDEGLGLRVGQWNCLFC
jgi:hypothetical protein